VDIRAYLAALRSAFGTGRRAIRPCRFICMVALTLMTVRANADTLAYALALNPQTGTQQSGVLDLATGMFSSGVATSPIIQYLAPGPNGSYLTMSFDGNLDSINPLTGATTVIGPTGFGDCSSPSSPCGSNSQLSFGSAGGKLYGTDFANNLYAIEPTTGKATLIGATGVPGVPFVPASTNPDGSFNFYDENLFGADGHLFLNFDAGIFDPATSVNTTVIAAMLYELDPNTGQATKVGSTAFGLLTVSNLYGAIYGFNAVTNQIVTLDVTNGATSTVGDLDPSIGLILGAAPVGIAPIPEPASIALVLTGVSGLLVSRRKKIV